MTEIAKQIYPSQWLQLPVEARIKIALHFGLGKSGATEVVDNRVVSDGYTALDLQDLTLEKMQEYLNSKEKDILKLLELTASKILTPVITVIPTKEIDVLPPEEAKRAKKEYKARMKVAKKLGKKGKK